MKTVVVIGMIVVGSSLQAFSMGHPHNVFAARKHMRTKTTATVVKTRTDLSVCWHQAIQATRTTVSDVLTIAFSHVSPARTF